MTLCSSFINLMAELTGWKTSNANPVNQGMTSHLFVECQELQAFLIYNKIDIASISEIHYAYRSYVKIHGYADYHTLLTSGNAYAGTTNIVVKNIPHFVQKGRCFDYFQGTVFHSGANFSLFAACRLLRHRVLRLFGTICHRRFQCLA